MTEDSKPDIKDSLRLRYGDIPDTENVPDLLHSMISRGSCRSFQQRPVPPSLLNLIAATAFASPTKSDLQQRDIIFLEDADLRNEIASLVSGQAWVKDAPMIAVICGNNRRQRLLHEWHGVPFANDHLDAIFNAIGDAAIALGAFVTAAEALGLGCCPISAVRNQASEVSELLKLPQHVFPFAGLAIGYPAAQPIESLRLPLNVTCHVDHYQEDNLETKVSAYDIRRATAQPYPFQRASDIFDNKPDYSWSDDKVRQYSQSERAAFGAYIRAQGFNLD